MDRMDNTFDDAQEASLNLRGKESLLQKIVASVGINQQQLDFMHYVSSILDEAKIPYAIGFQPPKIEINQELDSTSEKDCMEVAKTQFPAYAESLECIRWTKYMYADVTVTYLQVPF